MEFAAVVAFKIRSSVGASKSHCLTIKEPFTLKICEFGPVLTGEARI